METEKLLTFEWAGNSVPCVGETLSGDATFVAETSGGLWAGLIDVSGHGPLAHALAEELVGRLRRCAPGNDVVATIDELHEACRGTRGAACGLVQLDRRRGSMAYAGIGNTRCMKLGPAKWTGLSRDGILGGRKPSLWRQETSLAVADTICLTSDGIESRWKEELLNASHLMAPATLVDRVIREMRKPFDDASCIIIRCS